MAAEQVPDLSCGLRERGVEPTGDLLEGVSEPVLLEILHLSREAVAVHVLAVAVVPDQPEAAVAAGEDDTAGSQLPVRLAVRATIEGVLRLASRHPADECEVL